MDEVSALNPAHGMFPIHAAVGPINPHLAVADETLARGVVENIIRVRHGKREGPGPVSFILEGHRFPITPARSTRERALRIFGPVNAIRGKSNIESGIFAAVAIPGEIEIGHLVTTIGVTIARIHDDRCTIAVGSAAIGHKYN